MGAPLGGLMECIIPVAVFLTIVIGIVWEGLKPRPKRTSSYRGPIFDGDGDDDNPSFEPRHVDEFLKDGGRYWQKYPNRSGAISAMLDDMLNGDDHDR